MPPKLAAACQRVGGGLPTLDPCSYPDQFLEAERYLYGGDEDDGMRERWVDGEGQPGFVVLNPSHASKTPDESLNFKFYPVGQWVSKAAAEAAQGVTVIALLPAATDRQWFHQYVADSANSVCLLRKRVKSYIPGYGRGCEPRLAPQPMNPHMLVLWTKDLEVFERFYEEFGDGPSPLGLVFEPNPLFPKTR